MPALNLVLIGADDCRHRAVVAAPSALDGWGGWTIEHILLSIEKRFGPRLVRKAGQGEPFNRALDGAGVEYPARRRLSALGIRAGATFYLLTPHGVLTGRPPIPDSSTVIMI